MPVFSRTLRPGRETDLPGRAIHDERSRILPRLVHLDEHSVSAGLRHAKARFGGVPELAVRTPVLEELRIRVVRAGGRFRASEHAIRVRVITIAKLRDEIVDDRFLRVVPELNVEDQPDNYRGNAAYNAPLQDPCAMSPVRLFGAVGLQITAHTSSLRLDWIRLIVGGGGVPGNVHGWL